MAALVSVPKGAVDQVSAEECALQPTRPNGLLIACQAVIGCYRALRQRTGSPTEDIAMIELRHTALLLVLIASLLSTVGCGNMVKTTHTVDGKQVTTWADPETAKRIEQEERNKAARMEAYRAAEKRSPNDPIVVALYETEVEPQLKANVQGKLFEQLRKEFENDGVIRLVEQNRLARDSHQVSAMGTQKPNDAGADVVVRSSARVSEELGINPKTGKPAKMIALVYQAQVFTPYSVDHQYTVTESGNLFRNIEVTRSFADKVKSVIKNRLGPEIPKRSALARSAEPVEINLDDLRNSMKRTK